MTDTSQTIKPPLRFIFLYGKPAAGKDTAGIRLADQIEGSAILSTGDEIKRAKYDELYPLLEKRSK